MIYLSNRMVDLWLLLKDYAMILIQGILPGYISKDLYQKQSICDLKKLLVRDPESQMAAYY